MTTLELDSYRARIQKFAQQMRETGNLGIYVSVQMVEILLATAQIVDCREISCSRVHKTSAEAASRYKKLDEMPHLPLPNQPLYFEFADGFHLLALELLNAPQDWERIRAQLAVPMPFGGEDIFTEGERILFFPIGPELVFGVPGTLGRGAALRHELQGVKPPPNSAAVPTAHALERAGARLLGLLSLLGEGQVTTQALPDRFVLRMAP